MELGFFYQAWFGLLQLCLFSASNLIVVVASERRKKKNLCVGNPHELVGNQTAFSYYTFGKFFISKPFPCSLPLT
jgi:hypothetical protein